MTAVLFFLVNLFVTGHDIARAVLVGLGVGVVSVPFLCWDLRRQRSEEKTGRAWWSEYQ